MSMFKSYQKHTVRQKTDLKGAPVNAPDGFPIMQRISVPRWSTEQTIDYLRHNGREIMQAACKDNWHVNLIDFVQHQHRLPSSDECDEIYLDFQKIENATPHSVKRPKILERRERIKADLMRPLEPRAE